MVTVNHTILKHQKRSDNTWNVKLRITQNRKSAYLPTRHYVSIEQINKKTFELKQRDNPVYDDLMIDEVRIRKEFSSMGSSIENYTAKQLAEHIDNFLKGRVQKKINFFDYGYCFAQKAKDTGRSIGTTYEITVRKFETFVGNRDLGFTDITSDKLRKFEKWLRENKTRNGGVIGKL